MKKANELEKQKDGDAKKIFEIREKYRHLTSLLKGKTGYNQLEIYPQEVDYYLEQGEKKVEKMEKEKKEIEKELNIVSRKELSQKLQRKNNLEARIKELRKENDRNIVPKFLSYVTNNERL
jgi:hypothetical protein